MEVAKTLAGVCHSKDCVLRDRRRESAPWMLCFEVEGLFLRRVAFSELELEGQFAWPVQHFV